MKPLPLASYQQVLSTNQDISPVPNIKGGIYSYNKVGDISPLRSNQLTHYFTAQSSLSPPLVHSTSPSFIFQFQPPSHHTLG